MSTGKRLAKRSIIGTRVCAPGEDGKYYSGVIQAVKTPANFLENNNCINLTPNTRYTVRFDSRQGNLGRTTAEFFEMDLIGPGFQSVLGLKLVPEQKCFVTYNGREVSGEVCKHYFERDEVIIRIHPPGSEAPFEVQKRLEEVRLLESRKSARLADQDTDFARLADMAGDRKRTASHTIDVPAPSTHLGSRKRRPSSSQDDNYKDTQMDECSAALVLMSLSCSPHSPNFNGFPWRLSTSPDSNISSSSASYRSTPSPPPRAYSPQSAPLSSSAGSDEGIVMDYQDEQPRKKKGPRRAARRGGVLLHGGGAGAHQPAADAVPPRHGAAPARGPRLPAADRGLLPADAAGVGAPAVAPQAAEAVVAAPPQPQDAGVAAPRPGREQEVPQGLRHGPPGAVVHAVQVEEGLLQVRGLIQVTVTSAPISD
ncbi:uncharacterized protein Glut4EF isoform X2 [Tribolium castaneum]|uniref:uncharacterized protein Glut4EF isoform X2 n=1 Tax=Tribolium castaneum TaxID=7070 RepID=UPI0030FEB5CF